ncbi:SRPBCC domain-containing protein [Brachybacterium hainanense]|uniref:SRPBCC domain-containing protein n=1 Tax=Brachybacterium hainanense TaxID=1541174 RepID=A0ABV6R708_9MICO
MTDHPVPAAEPDEILRSVRIAASPQTVFDVIREPGWFINEGAYVPHEITDLGDGTFRVVDPVHGAFVIAADVLEPPRRAVFRWLGGDAGEFAGAPTTTIEFTLVAEGQGTLLTVRESGFASLDEDSLARRRRIEENTEGWEIELGIARDVAEQRAA